MSLLFTGQNRIELEETSSTNTFASEFLSHTPPEGTLILAKAQTSGRGQQGTRWQSTPGENLTFSLIYYPAFLPATDLFYLSKMTAMALYKTLSYFLPEKNIQIKWPNDLLSNHKKLAGILIENQLEGSRVKAAVIGIGLNVNQLSFEGELSERATSLQLEKGTPFNLSKVLKHLLSALEGEYLTLRQGKKDHLDRKYLNALYGYQSFVPLRINGEKKERMIIGVDKSGKLAIQEGQKVRYFDIKEVEFVF